MASVSAAPLSKILTFLVVIDTGESSSPPPTFVGVQFLRQLQRAIVVERFADVGEREPRKLLQHAILGDVRPGFPVFHRLFDSGADTNFR